MWSGTEEQKEKLKVAGTKILATVTEAKQSLYGPLAEGRCRTLPRLSPLGGDDLRRPLFRVCCTQTTRVRSKPDLSSADVEALHDIGIYNYRHPLENAVAYQDALDSIKTQIRAFIADGAAIEASTRFTFDNSLAKGRKMTADLAKLMLRAYNAEAKNCVRYVKAGNLPSAEKRLSGAATSIARYASMMEMHINPDYHALRLRELELTADYQMKVQEEREEAREERARLREEQQAERELRAERERLEKERAHYANVLEALSDSGSDQECRDLEGKIAEIDGRIAENDYRTANIRAGLCVCH